jgi:membrane protein
MFSQSSRLSKELLAATLRRWNRLNAPRLGASLAYYALLSMAPLSILVVAMCGLVFGKAQAEQYVLNQARELAGSSGEATLATLIENARHTGAGIFATIIAFLTLFFGASGVFVELRDTLNTIWQVPERVSSGIRGMLWQRLAAFAMVLGLGLLLLISLCVSAAFAFLEHFARNVLPLPAAVTGEVLNLSVSLLAMSVLFGLVFKFVPEAPVAWRDVAIGGVATAVLFTVGRSLLALYFSTSAVGSAYGAAGSLVAVVVWVYYSAQIFFFGAIFTRVYAERFGSRSEQNTRKHAQ